MNTKELYNQRERHINQLQQLEGRIRSIDGVMRGIAIAIRKELKKIDGTAVLDAKLINKGAVTRSRKEVAQKKEDELFLAFFETKLIRTQMKNEGLSTKEIASYYSNITGYVIPNKVVINCLRRIGLEAEPINTYGVKNDDQYRTTYRGYKGLAPRDYKALTTALKEWETKKATAPKYSVRVTILSGMALKEQQENPYHEGVEEALNAEGDERIDQVAELVGISYGSLEDIQL